MLDIFQSLMEGFATAITFKNILAGVVGGVLGIVVGAIPGLGSVTGVALLLPLTFSLNPITGIIMLAGVYYGNMYGGSYSAILINIPGDSPAVTTALDGYPMAKKGYAGKALFTANISSFIGGTIGVIILTFMGVLLANVALSFGPPEISLLILLALCSIGWLLGDSPKKGLVSTFIGMLLATIGLSATAGLPRFTFGSINMLNGVEFIPLVIGMFGFTQIMLMMKDRHTKKDFGSKLTIKESLLTKKEFKRITPVALRSSFLGNFIGLLPGAGATTGSLLSYIFQKRVGKNSENMGKGAMEGVSAAESANNAATVGSFAPLLSLGIPGSATSAVLLGGLLAWGLQPGPLLFENSPDFVWGLIASLYIGNVVVVIAAIFIIPVLMHIVRIPNSVMIPTIAVICIVGSYTINNNVFDIWVMLACGLIAFFLTINDYPIAPLLLSFVLTPRLEQSIHQSFSVSQGNMSIFVSSWISIVLLIAIAIFILSPLLMKLFKKNKEDPIDSTKVS